MGDYPQMTKRSAWIGVFLVSGLFWVIVCFAIYLLWISSL
ncbi:YmiA family putative membrane protein [Salmonella enterica subsp. enterica serovar Newport]|nr:YmiA family putative membrane protein [Salmonella enterica subsp. enterica serovar Newport]